MNIANLLTCCRFVLIPVFVLVFHREGDAKLISAAIFILASVTDILDGYLARKYQLITNFGKLMDPLADKGMQLAAIVCMLLAGMLPLWFIVVLVGKELILIAGSVFLFVKKTVVQSNVFGKLNTVILFIAIMLILMLGRRFPPAVTNVILGACVAASALAVSGYLYSYFLQSKQFKNYIGKGVQSK